MNNIGEALFTKSSRSVYGGTACTSNQYRATWVFFIVQVIFGTPNGDNPAPDVVALVLWLFYGGRTAIVCRVFPNHPASLSSLLWLHSASTP